MKVHQRTPTENLFVRFGCSVVSFLESRKLGTLARSLAGGGRFSCSLVLRGHGRIKKSGKESESECRIYRLEICIDLVSSGLLGPTAHEDTYRV